MSYEGLSEHSYGENVVNSGHGLVRVQKIITRIITGIFTTHGSEVCGPSFAGTGVNDE